MDKESMSRRRRSEFRAGRGYDLRRTHYGLYSPGGPRRRASVNVRRATGVQPRDPGNNDRRSARVRLVARNDRLLRCQEVVARCSTSRSKIYRLINQGRFPRPLKIGGRSVRWLESEITAWLASLPRATG